MNQFRLNEWDVFTQSSITDFGVEVYFRQPGDGGMIFLTSKMELKLYKMGDMPPEPTMRLPEGILPVFFQHLWDKGLRPKDRRYEAEAELLRGQLDLQGKHLQDMRSLVFQKPEAKL